MSELLHQQKYKSSLLKRRLQQLAIATGATKSRDVMFTIPQLPILNKLHQVSLRITSQCL